MRIHTAFTCRVLFFYGVLVLASVNPAQADREVETSWKAGVGRIEITPEAPLWMAGFASRTQPSEGVLLPLWAKALALEDEQGNQAVLVTSDLLGFPKTVSDRIRDRIETDHGLGRAQIILSGSHTHGGPVIGDSLRCMYPMNAEHEADVLRYTATLEDKIVALVGDALNALMPAALFSGNGIARIAVNNRNNNEAAMTASTLPVGPSDYAVPTLSVLRSDGSLAAIVFGYACHPTALAGYLFSGDFTGYAQVFLEEAHPGAAALYFAGCGGDQKAIPRQGRTIAMARQYGQTLAAAVTRVLEEPMRPLAAHLRVAYDEVLLDLEPAPDADAYRDRAENTRGYEHLCNQWMLDRLEREGSLPTAWPVPVQLWRLGEQRLVTIGGEVMVEYALRIKELLGESTFVMGYANDLMSYLPSERVLEEGGYEGASAQLIYGMPNVWKPGLEARILDAVEGLARITE